MLSPKTFTRIQKHVFCPIRTRFASSIPEKTFAWCFQGEGPIKEKLTKVEIELPSKLEPDEVLLRFLAVPVSGTDVNVDVQGDVDIQSTSSSPLIGGSQGVAIVEAVGSGVSTLRQGDHVVSNCHNFGTWRQFAVGKAHCFDYIPKNVPIDQSACLIGDPFSAYRLLEDFVCLKPGDHVIINAANTTLGMSLIQLANKKGIKTINIVDKQTPEKDKVTENLRSLGADIVVDSEFLSTYRMKNLISDLGSQKPRLAVNFYGGEIATATVKHLEKEGFFVTVASLGKPNLTISTSSLIFQDIEFKGWNLAKWLCENNEKEEGLAERKKVVDDLCEMILKGEFQLPVETMPFARFEDTLKAQGETPLDFGRKIVFHM